MSINSSLYMHKRQRGKSDSKFYVLLSQRNIFFFASLTMKWKYVCCEYSDMFEGQQQQQQRQKRANMKKRIFCDIFRTSFSSFQFFCSPFHLCFVCSTENVFSHISYVVRQTTTNKKCVSIHTQYECRATLG